MSGRNLGSDIKQVISNSNSGDSRCRLKFLVLAPPLIVWGTLGKAINVSGSVLDQTSRRYLLDRPHYNNILTTSLLFYLQSQDKE